MLCSITKAAHAIAAAVTMIVTVGQLWRRKSLTDMQPASRYPLLTYSMLDRAAKLFGGNALAAPLRQDGVARLSLLNGTTVNPEQMTLHGHQAGCEGRAQAVTADCLLPGKIANLGLENRTLLRCTVSKLLLEIC